MEKRDMKTTLETLTHASMAAHDAQTMGAE